MSRPPHNLQLIPVSPSIDAAPRHVSTPPATAFKPLPIASVRQNVYSEISPAEAPGSASTLSPPRTLSASGGIRSGNLDNGPLLGAPAKLNVTSSAMILAGKKPADHMPLMLFGNTTSAGAASIAGSLVSSCSSSSGNDTLLQAVLPHQSSATVMSSLATLTTTPAAALSAASSVSAPPTSFAGGTAVANDVMNNKMCVTSSAPGSPTRGKSGRQGVTSLDDHSVLSKNTTPGATGFRPSSVTAFPMLGRRASCGTSAALETSTSPTTASQPGSDMTMAPPKKRKKFDHSSSSPDGGYDVSPDNKPDTTSDIYMKDPDVDVVSTSESQRNNNNNNNSSDGSKQNPDIVIGSVGMEDKKQPGDCTSGSERNTNDTGTGSIGSSTSNICDDKSDVGSLSPQLRTSPSNSVDSGHYSASYGAAKDTGAVSSVNSKSDSAGSPEHLSSGSASSGRSNSSSGDSSPAQPDANMGSVDSGTTKYEDLKDNDGAKDNDEAKRSGSRSRGSLAACGAAKRFSFDSPSTTPASTGTLNTEAPPIPPLILRRRASSPTLRAVYPPGDGLLTTVSREYLHTTLTENDINENGEDSTMPNGTAVAATTTTAPDATIAMASANNVGPGIATNVTTSAPAEALNLKSNGLDAGSTGSISSGKSMIDLEIMKRELMELRLALGQERRARLNLEDHFTQATLQSPPAEMPQPQKQQMLAPQLPVNPRIQNQNGSARSTATATYANLLDTYGFAAVNKAAAVAAATGLVNNNGNSNNIGRMTSNGLSNGGNIQSSMNFVSPPSSGSSGLARPTPIHPNRPLGQTFSPLDHRGGATLLSPLQSAAQFDQYPSLSDMSPQNPGLLGTLPNQNQRHGGLNPLPTPPGLMTNGFSPPLTLRATNGSSNFSPSFDQRGPTIGQNQKSGGGPMAFGSRGNVGIVPVSSVSAAGHLRNSFQNSVVTGLNPHFANGGGQQGSLMNADGGNGFSSTSSMSSLGGIRGSGNNFIPCSTGAGPITSNISCTNANSQALIKEYLSKNKALLTGNYGNPSPLNGGSTHQGTTPGLQHTDTSALLQRLATKNGGGPPSGLDQQALSSLISAAATGNRRLSLPEFGDLSQSKDRELLQSTITALQQGGPLSARLPTSSRGSCGPADINTGPEGQGPGYRQNLEAIVEAIRHLEGKDLFIDTQASQVNGASAGTAPVPGDLTIHGTKVKLQAQVQQQQGTGSNAGPSPVVTLPNIRAQSANKPTP